LLENWFLIMSLFPSYWLDYEHVARIAQNATIIIVLVAWRGHHATIMTMPVARETQPTPRF
jgi:hypothetical protein